MRIHDVLKPWLARLPGPVAGVLVRSRRASQVARDVVMVVGGVLGPRRPVAREYRSGEAGGVVLPGERRLKVLAVRQETADAVSLVLERPAGMEYEAGQFLTLVLPIDGRELRRSYSLSSTPLLEGPLVITVKKVVGGAASGWIHRNVRPGMTLRVRGPSGNFVYRPSERPAKLVLVGGGSGITPLMGILRTAVEATPEVPVVLVYANRSVEDVIFREELAQLEVLYPQLTVRHVLEKEGGLPCSVGRVGRAELEAALGGTREGVRVYLCGPEGMMAAVQQELRALGLEDKQILLERFVTVRPREMGQEGRLYQLRVGSRQVEVPSGKTLLEGATAAGVTLDFSCTMGGCGACKARLVDGEVVMDEPNCLSEAERAEGLVLTCVARPLSDVTIEQLH
ncbi:MAG: ferredoxin--NADP reductase [Myxococcales bacterium]|nr:ferredoxin--NADP reductase [Myxococcales bacterium]